VMSHQPKRLRRARISAIKQSPIHSHQYPEQAERNRHAADRQDATAPVAQTIPENKRHMPKHS
jgi:hypothetical protein